MSTKQFSAIIILSICLPTLLTATQTGVFITDCFKYSGEWTHYASLGDAQDQQNPLDQSTFADKDLSIYVVSTEDEQEVIIMNSWWYTTAENTNGLPKDDPGGDNLYSGQGNLSYSGIGAIEIDDYSADELDIAFINPTDTVNGPVWPECSLHVTGSNVTGEFARGFCIDSESELPVNCHIGEFLTYDLQITVSGVYGSREVFGDLIASSDHPSSASGGFNGIFQLDGVEGYYVIEWYISGSAWAADQSDDSLNGDFLESYFVEDVGVSLTTSSSAGGDVNLPGEGTYVYDSGQTVELLAVATDVNHVFSHWNKDGEFFSDVNPIELSVTESHSIRAFFEFNQIEISIDPNDGPVQDIVDTAQEDAVITLAPGIYDGIEIADQNGIQLVGADPNQVQEDYPVIVASEGRPALVIKNADAGTVISGFTITGGNGYRTGGIECINSSPTFRNCLIVGNKSSGDPYGAGAVSCVDSNPVFENCTFADNLGGENGSSFFLENSDPVIRNSIIWNNSPQSISVDIHSDPNITYCDIEGGWSSVGIIDTDPLFALPGTWIEGVWNDENMDYHLLESYYRFVGSPCIDAGDPNTPVGYEPLPNGGIINLGSYGGTRSASLSPEPPEGS